MLFFVGWCACTLQLNQHHSPSIMKTDDQSGHLPRWACVSIAVVAALVGLASSVVTAKFFVLGLERLETDTVAREVLIAAGMLMIVTELLAFGLVALLPANQLRALRTKLIVCGFLLLAFEAVTIYVTQVSLMQTASAGSTANQTRIQDLRATIDNRRAAAQSLRANGALQSGSSNAWTRTVGAAALRDALKVEQQIDPLAAELAGLEATAKPTMDGVLGGSGMLFYSVARALLISGMGLMMFAAAGALLRESRHKPKNQPMASSNGLTQNSMGSPTFRYSTFSLPTQSITSMVGATTPTPDTPTTSAVPVAAVAGFHYKATMAPSEHAIGSDSHHVRTGQKMPVVGKFRDGVRAGPGRKGWFDKIPNIPARSP